MITIFIHSPSLVIGFIIGFIIAYIILSLALICFTRFEPTDFQSGYEAGKKNAEKEIKNGRTEEKPEQED